jgi:hypothetical protein
VATTVTRSSGGGSDKNGQVPIGQVSPEEAAAIRASVATREVAPSSRIQSGVANWRLAVDQLGSPFEVDRIAVSQLRRMRRDPMLGFGLSFIKMPHVRAKWFINARSSKGTNAQIAAHLDHDLRIIYPSLVLQFLTAMDFGFQALAKRFELRIPAGTYIETNPDTGEQEEKPIWSEGGVDPIGWKPFIPLRPEGVEPIWNSQGEFDGIEYDPASPAMPAGAGAVAQGGGGNNAGTTYKIDLAHSLWFTPSKDENFGSIFGYPRLGYAFRYWWSYWFRWSIADRAFERKADPSVIVYHPPGEFVDETTGTRMDYSEYALLMGERMRSGGVLALPSETYEDANGRGTIRQWEIDFTKDATNFDPFDKSFEYLDVQKLRSLFIPEQAFLEGKGGTSSRNVAAELGNSFIESQAVLNQQIVEHINRYTIPQWLAVNYPDFVATESGVAEIVMQGFADEDVSFQEQIIQLIGQQESGMKEVLKIVDLKRLLETRGTPIADFPTQKRMENQIAQEAAAQGVGNVTPIPGQQVGTAPTSTGFSYIAPRDLIYLSDNGTDFIESLPDTNHYSDTAIKGFSRRLWNVYRDLYVDEYKTVIASIENSADGIQLAEGASGSDLANEIVNVAPISDKWPDTLKLTGNLLDKIMRRAGRNELKRANLKAVLPEAEFSDWINSRFLSYASKIAETTRVEVRDFIANALEDGITDRAVLASMAREHFTSFPDWKADRLVRTEVREAYNSATLSVADAAGVQQVQAIDGQLPTSDEESKKRDGQIYTLSEAAHLEEHPNGTLGFRILPTTLSIERSDDETGADFDRETGKLVLSNSLDPEVESRILRTVVDSL